MLLSNNCHFILENTVVMHFNECTYVQSCMSTDMIVTIIMKGTKVLTLGAGH